MNTPRLTAACLLGLATLLSSVAQASVTEQSSKPKNRLAAKLKPQTAVAPLPADEPLSEEQMAVAPRVNAGEAQCEFNQKVSITANPDKPGRFRLQFGKMVYNMTPEPTTTGAVRLEDKASGVVWVQIPAKSMLMNTKLGQRMVDSCQHPEQQAFVNDAKQNPDASNSGIGITPGTSIAQ